MVLTDKVQHAIGGAAVACCVPALLWLDGRFGVLWAMVAAAAAVGVAFEVVQSIRGEGQVEGMDVLATAGGGAAVALVLMVARAALGDGA